MLPLADVSVAVYAFMLAALFTSVLLMLRGNRYFKRPSRQPSAVASTATPGDLSGARSALPSPAHVQAQRERWEVEMHELARSFSAQVDTKAGRLEQLIREADRAAARLEAALAVAQRAAWQTPLGGVSSAARAAVVVADTAPASEASSQAAKLLAAETAAPGPPAAVAQAAAAPTPPAENSLQSGQSDGSSRPRTERYDEIYLLSDYGYGTAEIARRVAVPQGEVELILSLRSRR